MQFGNEYSLHLRSECMMYKRGQLDRVDLFDDDTEILPRKRSTQPLCCLQIIPLLE